MTNDEVAAKLQRLLAGEPTDEGYITTLDVFRFVHKHRATILSALRAEPSEEEVEREHMSKGNE